MSITLPSRAPDYTIQFPADGVYAPGTELQMGGGLALAGTEFTVDTDGRGQHILIEDDPFSLGGLMLVGAPPTLPDVDEVYVRARFYFEAFFPAGNVDDLEFGTGNAYISIGQRTVPNRYYMGVGYGSDFEIFYTTDIYIERRLAIKPGIALAEIEISDPDTTGSILEDSWSISPASVTASDWPAYLFTRNNVNTPRIYAFDIWNGVADPAAGMWKARQRQNPAGNTGGWPTRHRQNAGDTGGWATRDK